MCKIKWIELNWIVTVNAWQWIHFHWLSHWMCCIDAKPNIMCLATEIRAFNIQSKSFSFVSICISKCQRNVRQSNWNFIQCAMWFLPISLRFLYLKMGKKRTKTLHMSRSESWLFCQLKLNIKSPPRRPERTITTTKKYENLFKTFKQI